MKVKTITVSFCRSDGHFGNERIELEVELADDDKPEEAYARAEAFIKRRLGRDIAQEIADRKEQVEQLAASIDTRVVAQEDRARQYRVDLESQLACEKAALAAAEADIPF